MTTNNITLSQLQKQITQTLQQQFSTPIWVVAETSDVRANRNGHCYLELIEKEEKSQRLTAKVKAVIFANRFLLLKKTFEEQSGTTFTSGIKVLLLVSVNYHELYGFSLIVHSIDPTYTIGEMKKRQKEIILQLKQEGVWDQNKQQKFPILPQRIAVISSATAAGWDDFKTHLEENGSPFNYQLTLFQAIMQGADTEPTIIAALEQINSQIESFDLVAIIRGGGATSDLNSFDSYELCYYITQFPLPIISGIGHERDETIIDMIAHTRAKTPTAAAEFVVNCFREEAFKLADFEQQITQLSQRQIEKQKNTLAQLEQQLFYNTRTILEREKEQVRYFKSAVPQLIQNRVLEAKNELSKQEKQLIYSCTTWLNEQKHLQQLYLQKIELLSPFKLLERGYSLTWYNGQILTNKEQVKKGDIITTQLQKGTITSKIEE